jgi:hypothetical protein
MNRDFVEMLFALSDAGADFLIVGAHALAAHGRPRATGDLDLLIRPAPANAVRVRAALEAFGAPLFGLTNEELSEPGMVLQIGVVPCRIDIITSITGVSFDEAWAGRIAIEVEGRIFSCLGRAELLANKRATGRPKDLVDVATLEEDEDS